MTVNVYRPGSVDTARQEWIRRQPPDQIGVALHKHFRASYEQGSLITPEHSARSLLAKPGRGRHRRGLDLDRCLRCLVWSLGELVPITEIVNPP